MKLTFLGAAHEVTGSCHYLEACGKKILIDCGMQQGPDEYEHQEVPLIPGDIDYVLLTHAHFDHMLYARPWLKDGVKLYVHKLDAPALADPSLNLSGVVGAQLTLPDADVLLEEGDCVEEAGIRFDVLHTPGHTPGSVCYRHEKTLFCGDTLFYQGYGRVDLAGGNSLQRALSLKRLLKLPGNTVCYPGHGMKTKIAWEQEANA